MEETQQQRILEQVIFRDGGSKKVWQLVEGLCLEDGVLGQTGKIKAERQLQKN